MSLSELATVPFFAFAASYGPFLVVVALAIYAWSLPPAARGASWLQRRARSPLFWAWLPPLLAATIALVLAVGLADEAVALPSGPQVTLTKTTTTHFTQTGATLSRYVDPSADQLTLFSNLSPSTAMAIGPLMPYIDGDGAHAIESAIGEFLVIHGEKQNVSSVLSELAATTLAGPTFNDGATPTPTQLGVAKGAFSIARGDGTFLLVLGGDTDPQPTPPAPQLRPLATQVITPATSLGGTWTAAPGPNLSGTSGAGLGAHAIKVAVGGVNKLLIVHAGGGVSGTADTSLYTPPQCQNGVGTPPACTGGTFVPEAMVAGPAFVTNKRAGKGAVSVSRGDGTFLVVLGGGGNDTQIYTPPTALTGTDAAVKGTFAAGPSLGNAADDGTFAIQYKNAANQDRYAIVRGGANAAVVYDPNATPATSAGMLGSLSIPAPSPARGGGKVGAGAAGFLRPDGTVVGFYGSQETLAFVFTPSASAGGADLANNGAFTALNLTNSPPMDRGSFVLHQRDGRMLVFPGSSVETRYNDAGWALSGTYESEPINAGNVDQWTSVSWTRGPDDLTLEWRAAKAKDLLANATYATVATSGGQTGTAAIAPGTANKWIQARATFKRAGAASTGAQAAVWLGSSSVVQRRALTAAAPVLSDFSLGYTAGVFVLSARSPETAGVGFPLTVELRDSANARIVDYQGNHTLTFAGAGVAPDGQSKPTIRDRAGADVAFGQPTGLALDTTGLGIGTATRRATLYKKEEIDVTATETVTFPGPFVAFTLSTHTLTTQAAAHLLTNAAGPSATKSTLVAAPAVVKPNGTDGSTLTLTITDAFGNILPGLQATLASDRGSVDTLSRTTLPPSDFSGKSTATLSSTTRGVANVTATVLGPPTDAAIPQRFFGTAVTAFRAGPVGSTLWQAPTTAPGTAALTSTLSYGTATGSRQVVPGAATSTAGSPGASATNKGWRDESYARASQATTAGRLSGDWTFTYSLALTTGTQPVTTQMTVVAYAVDASNSAREMFRNTTTDLSIGPAELNYAQTFTPSYAVLNGVAGYLAAGEVLQYEVFLNVSQNPNSSSGSVVQFRAGAAGNTLAPPDVEAGAISDLPNTIQQTALTPATKVSFFGGQVPVTLSKTTASHFAAGTPGTGVTTSAAGIALAGAPATSVTTASLSQAAGDGAHTLQGNGGELLIVHGNGSTATTIYSPSGTTSAGPSFGSPIGKGAFSFPISGGYLLVAGGGTDVGAQPLRTYVVTPAALLGGSWTIGAGPNLAGSTGAGLGAHAVKFSVSGTTKFLIVHGDGTGKVSVYSTATGLVTAGPSDLVIPATGLPGLPLGAAGAGAHAIPRTDGKYLIVLGNGTTGTNVYDPASGGDGSFAGGPVLGAAVGAGGHAIQYKNGAGLSRALIVAGNGTAASAIYDPAAAVGAGVSAGPTLPSTVTTGGLSLLRGNGTVLILAGGGMAAGTFTPSTEIAAAATLTGLPAIGAGAHAFQRSDGQFVIVAGGASLAVYDAAWPLTGTYETEGLNPLNVDHWDKASWTKSSDGTVTVSARVATTQAGLASAAYADITTAQAASGFASINGAVGSRWVQAKLALARTVPASTDAEAGVWLGSSSLVQDRSRGPFVTRVALDYLSGAFTVSVAAAAQTAGATNVATISLRDSANAVIADYTGSHTLVLAGANPAPGGTQPNATTPTSADLATTVTFGGATALTFASGAATTTLTLYKAETASLTASETAAVFTGSAYGLTGYTIDVNGPAQVAVSAGAAFAAKSSATASPASVPADNATVSTIAVRVKDQFENGLAGLTTVTLGSFQTTAGDRAGLDTLTNPATTDATGLGTGTIRSTRSGTVTITVSVGGSALAIPSPPTVTFAAGTFTVVTQHGGTETAGVAFTLTITAKDASGATVTSYAGSKTIAFTTTARPRTTPVAGPSAIVTTPQLITFTAGVATTSSLTGSACNQPGTTPCAFTLYNTAQTPTITATDGAFPTGTSAPITVVPAAPSLTVSTFVADPLVVAPDNKDTSNLTAQVMDSFGNPISGQSVTFSSSRNSDSFFQPAGPTGADGIAVGQITSLTVGTPTVSAAVAGVGTLSTTRVINFVQPGGATRVLVIRTQHVEQETAGVAFSLTVIGIQADGTTDKTFCGASSCSLTITNSAVAAPDGTAPTGTLTKNAPNFVNGQYTTNATDGNLITFFRANQQPAPIVTVTVTAPNASIIGVTPPITVQPGAVNLTKSYVYAVPDLVPADGTSTATLGAKVLDTWKNPISGRSVTFASSRGVSDVVAQPSAATGGLGIAFGSISSTVASVPGQASTFATITGTVTGVGAIATTGTPTPPPVTVTFFGSPGGGRIQNGTRPGAVVNGAATDFTLAIVARDLEGLELATDTIINWSLRGQGDGTFTTTATTSGASTPVHATQFTARRAGTVTITGGYLIPAGRVGAGTQVAIDLTYKIVSQFDVKATTTEGKVVTARVEWDGTTLRTLSWVTTGP